MLDASTVCGCRKTADETMYWGLGLYIPCRQDNAHVVWNLPPCLAHHSQVNAAMVSQFLKARTAAAAGNVNDLAAARREIQRLFVLTHLQVGLLMTEPDVQLGTSF